MKLDLDDMFSVFVEPIEFIFGKKDSYPEIIKYALSGYDTWHKNADTVDHIEAISLVYGGWICDHSTMVIKSARGLELSLQVEGDVRNQFGSAVEWITATYAYQLENDILKEDVVHTGGTFRLQHYKVYYAALYILRNLDAKLCEKILKLMDVYDLLNVCDEENLMEAKMMVLRVNHDIVGVTDDILEL